MVFSFIYYSKCPYLTSRYLASCQHLTGTRGNEIMFLLTKLEIALKPSNCFSYLLMVSGIFLICNVLTGLIKWKFSALPCVKRECWTVEMRRTGGDWSIVVSRCLIELQYGTVFRRLLFLSFLLLAISKTDSVLARELGENLGKLPERTVTKFCKEI